MRQDIAPRNSGSHPVQYPASVEMTAATAVNPTVSEASAGSQIPSPETVSKPRAHRFLFSKKYIIIVIIIVTIVAGVIVVVKRSSAGTATATNTPDYQTILPSDKSIKELGGWKRISPPENDPVFAYADEINKVPISISQQPLPKTFQNNTDNQVAELAKKFNATVKLDAGSTAIYIGTSAKGPQSVILTKNNLLIMIKSQKKIDNKAWIKYAESLS